MTTSHFVLNTKRRAQGQSISDIAMAARTEAAERPDCFVVVLPEGAVSARAAEVEEALSSDADLPLAGLTFCVKDNIDVAGWPSTGNCPGFGQVATKTAPVVQKAIEAGAILIGKNTMDQFATGLNGTRSPAPICRNAIDATIIPGGSSSGSAVAVAAGICDFSFGSDTGGSGRVPAAANGIVGFKPTPGAMSARGMLYCNRSFDVIPIFTNTVTEAAEVFAAVGGPDPLDPFAFQGPLPPPSPSARQTYAVPDTLEHFGDKAAKAAHRANLARLADIGGTLTQIDFAPFKEAGDLVFQSALVAERLIDFGDFIQNYPDKVVGPVAEAISAGRSFSAQDLFKVQHRLAELKRQCNEVLAKVDALVVPTIPRLFTIEEMLADPMHRNTIMGTYTYFANPLGLSAIAVPGVQRSDGLPSSLCFVGPGGSDFAMLQTAGSFASPK